jgi:hypothetical protein
LKRVAKQATPIASSTRHEEIAAAIRNSASPARV